jgi:hypothetical protein
VGQERYRLTAVLIFADEAETVAALPGPGIDYD